MRLKARGRTLGALPVVLGWLIAGCGGPSTNSQTNWLRACRLDGDCGTLRCLCGACTRSCSDDTTCTDLPGAACISAQDAGAIALCGGDAPSIPGVCLPPCSLGQCPSGTACVAGVCSGVPEATARVTVDTATRYQTLVGFGAGVAYTDGEIARHPRKAALYQAMFADLGSDLIRLRNRYGTTDTNLASFAEIVAAAAASLGRRPTVLVTSWSPPAALKVNGSTQCAGNPETCTLTRLPGGGFDYAGFAAYWRGAVEAHANAGIAPDYIGLQNNPNWVPDASASIEACRFLPTEGTATVPTSSGAVEVAYPGFAQALAAVAAELAEVASPPRIMAPETSDYHSVAEYLSSLDAARLAAIAHHLYGTDPASVDTAALAQTGDLGRQYQLPVFQSEMQTEGFETALMMHYALAVEGVSAYVQAGFAESASSLTGNPRALIAMGTSDFTIQLPYHAMRHYSFHTDPGWIRVTAESTSTDLLTSAWLSPAEDALTLVVLNSRPTEIDVKVEPGQTRWTSSEVTRTAFEGVERSAELGAVPAQGVLRVPGHAMLTVALKR